MKICRLLTIKRERMLLSDYKQSVFV